MAELDDALSATRSLMPDDRLRLIIRLWADLPPDHWAAPTAAELASVERRMAEFENGRSAELPWDIVRQIMAQRDGGTPSAVKHPAQKIYSAPRRFDLFTIMVVTAAYAILLSGMSALEFYPLVSCSVAGFITLVGVGQPLLFRGRYPRLASVVMGATLYFFGCLVFAYLHPRWGVLPMIPFALIASGIFGSFFGYLAGAMVGGVFLVADAMRRRYGTDEDAIGSPTGAADHSPFGEADA